MSKAALVLLILSSLCLPFGLAVASAPVAGAGPRLVLHAPWADGLVLVRAAGGTPIGPFQAPMGMLAQADESADFDARLRLAGAWAVLDGTAIAQLCGAIAPSINQRMAL